MAKVITLTNNFSAGELSPLALGRTEFVRYRLGAKAIENWRVLLQGGLQTREGTRYVASNKDSTVFARLMPFEPSETEAYVLEAGNTYLRFYTAGARLESGGTPVELATPYLTAQLRALRTAQANDVMIIAHGSHAPRQLSRLTSSTFQLNTISFDPPPTFEGGYAPSVTLTPSATTGTVTLTAGGSAFLASDVQRVVTSGASRAVITAVTSATVATALVLSAFVSTATIAAGSWSLTKSPVAACKPDVASPKGGVITLELLADEGHGPDLVTDGDFTIGAGAWMNLSAPLVLSGLHDGAGNSASLVDTLQGVLSSRGVMVGHGVTNTTDVSVGVVSAFATTVTFNDTITLNPVLAGGTDNDFDVGDAYTIHQTGYARFTGGRVILNGQAAGIGWIEQGIVTVPGLSYEVVFDVHETPASFMVGSASGLSDLLAEMQYVIGNEHTVTFEASSAISYLSFRNNQAVEAAIDNVTGKQLSIEGWRATDVGRYVRINDGLVRITSVTDVYNAVGEIIVELTSDATAGVGTWSLRDQSWSDTLGWPTVTILYEGRLYFAGSARFPQTIWGSAVDDLFNFFVGDTAEDAVQFGMQDSGGNITLNHLRALMPAENMLALTSQAEYRLIGAGDDPLTATSPPRVRVQSTYGSATVQPIKVGPALVFAQRQGSALREMAFQESTQGFIARNLTRLSGHLLKTQRILELGYQGEPEPIVWALRDDGVLLGFTYDLVEQVEAWHRTVTDGVIESFAIIPHPTALGDQLWISVQRTVDGAPVRYVEVFDMAAMMQGLTEVDGVIPSWTGLTVDSGSTYSFTTPTTALTGLSHLEGRTVAIVADGAPLPAQVVMAGGLTLPVAATTVWIGLPFTCTAEMLPLEIQLGDGQTTQTRKKRWIEVTARVDTTLGLKVNGEALDMRTPPHAMDQGSPPQTGDFRLKPPPGGWTQDGTVTVVQEDPLPATLLALINIVDIEVE